MTRMTKKWIDLDGNEHFVKQVWTVTYLVDGKRVIERSKAATPSEAALQLIAQRAKDYPDGMRVISIENREGKCAWCDNPAGVNKKAKINGRWYDLCDSCYAGLDKSLFYTFDDEVQSIARGLTVQ